MLKSKLLIGILLAVILLSGTALKNDEQSERTEVLTVEILITGRIQQIVISTKDGSEEIPLDLVTAKSMSSNAMIVRNKLAEFIDDGWEIKSDVGGNEYQRYVLIKK